MPSIWYRLYRDTPPTASSSFSAESQSAAGESSSHGPWRRPSRLNRDTCTMPRPSEIEIRPVFEVADFGEALTPEIAELHERNREQLAAR